jgi:fatty acid desaturase
VLWTNAGIAVTFAALAASFGWRAVILVHLPVVLIAGAVGVFLFFVQHQFEETYWAPDEDLELLQGRRSLAARSSTCHRRCTGSPPTSAYHHIHHLASLIPNYRWPSASTRTPACNESRISHWGTACAACGSSSGTKRPTAGRLRCGAQVRELRGRAPRARARREQETTSS